MNKNEEKYIFAIAGQKRSHLDINIPSETQPEPSEENTNINSQIMDNNESFKLCTSSPPIISDKLIYATELHRLHSVIKRLIQKHQTNAKIPKSIHNKEHKTSHKFTKCPNCSATSYSLMGLKFHLNTNCPDAIIVCPFKKVMGCTFVCRRKEMKLHLFSLTESHIEGTLNVIESLNERMCQFEKHAKGGFDTL